MNLKGQIIGTIPHSDGLYRIIAMKPPKDKDYAAAASGKMTISEAHRKLGHLAYGAIEHAISKGYIPELSWIVIQSQSSVMHVPKQSLRDSHSPKKVKQGQLNMANMSTGTYGVQRL